MTTHRNLRGVGVSPGLAYAPAVVLDWKFPSVADRWVTPVETDVEVARLNEAVKAVVELKPGATVTPEVLMAYLRPRLGGVKTPKSVEVWETLPRSPVGKVLKRTVRERYWQGRTRSV